MEIKNRQLPAEGMATDQYKMWGREQCASKMWTVNNSVTSNNLHKSAFTDR